VADNYTFIHLINPGFQHIRFEGLLAIHLRFQKVGFYSIIKELGEAVIDLATKKWNIG